MARLIPSDFDPETHRADVRGAEALTLARLQAGLSDQYTIFHGVYWAKAGSSSSAYGEIDFIIANPWGRLLAIEQKDTHITSSGSDLFARYSSPRARWGEQGDQIFTDKSITTQINRNLNGLRQQYSRRYPGRDLSIDHLLYLPTARLKGALPSSVDPDRVVDADRDGELIAVIESLLREPPARFSDAMLDELPDIHDFLAQKVGAVPHIGLLGHAAREFTTHLSGGLSTWVSRLSMAPWRLRVRGTAGSGKTQLALQLLRQARREDKQALYLCFNRPLADAMKQLAPDPGRVMTFHELARELFDPERPLDFSGPGVFTELEDHFIAVSPRLANTIDVLVIDEGQDFDADWAKGVLGMAKPDAHVLWLEDPEQALYQDRVPMEFPDWVQLSSPVNYRSPKAVVSLINTLGLTEEPVEAGGSIEGFSPHWLTYAHGTAAVMATADAIGRLMGEGYRPANIAVLSFKGVKNSDLLGPSGAVWLAGWPTRRPIGFDAQNSALWTEGDLLVDSVRRFKGQAADAVVITEIDFAELGMLERRLLFVALTRARLQVALVMSERASRVLLERLYE